MFKTIEDKTADAVEILVEGVAHQVPANISVAAAALLCGLSTVRETPVTGAGRLPYCMMGVCFDCLMEIDGQPNQRACQVTVAAGMTIERQLGAAGFEEL
ncbi:MAG: (2Fe-2S)-binding protein [Gammaproteobacteria bacterium]|nr:(2Fe-2S)-binding protein [Gammaproteobacteria bacterium]